MESGEDIVLYNNGDGHDTIQLGEYSSAVTISLGGIALEDILLGRKDDDLLIRFDHTGQTKCVRQHADTDHGRAHSDDGIVLENWFDTTTSDTEPMVTLQLIEGTDAPNPDDPTQIIRRYDFSAVADAYAASDSHTDSWSIIDAAMEAHLGDSDSDAIGGTLAYRYAVDGTTDQVSQDTITTLLANRQLGSEPQSIHGIA